MISPRRLDRHAAQQRMIQIRRFEPGNVGRDLEELLEHREHAADDCRGQDAVADRERALDSDHRPIDRARIKKIDRPDQPESEREQPDGEADAKSGADSRLRRRTCWVSRTAVKPLINPMTRIGASILPTRMLLQRLT